MVMLALIIKIYICIKNETVEWLSVIGANVYGNGVLLGKYDTEERALEIIDKIQKFIMNGSSFDDMYGSRRVNKCNIFIMPEE